VLHVLLTSMKNGQSLSFVWHSVCFLLKIMNISCVNNMRNIMLS